MLKNPYHDGEFSHTWFHGSHRDDLGDLNSTKAHEKTKPGKVANDVLMGTHFSPLHAVSTHFLRPETDSAMYHSHLDISNPAHFPTEEHLNRALFRHFANSPELQDENHEIKLRSGRDPDTAYRVKQDQDTPESSDQRRHYDQALKSHVAHHPNQHAIVKSFVDKLHSEGHDGITYGNGVEGPKFHTCAIATKPESIHVHKVDEHPAVKDAQYGPRPTVPMSDEEKSAGLAVRDEHMKQNEPNEMLDDISRHHNGGSMVRGFKNTGTSAFPQYKGSMQREARKQPQLRMVYEPPLENYQGHDGKISGKTDHVIRALTPTDAGELEVGRLHLNSKVEPSYVRDLGEGVASGVYVRPEYRHLGIGAAMWNHAKDLGLSPQHDDVQTPEGKEWAAKTAAVEGDTKAHGDYTMTYSRRNTGAAKPTHLIQAFHGDDEVGRMEWHGTHHRVLDTKVDPDHRHKGLASAMWNWGQTMRPAPKHSPERTDDGDAWAKSVGGPLPRRVSSLQSSQSMHPNLNHYRDGGMGGVGEDHSVVGYVPTHTLAKMPGNSTDEPGVQRHQEALRSGDGFKDPVMVMFDPRHKRAIVGEGNHRIEAAKREGITHVPTRVIRAPGSLSDSNVAYHESMGGHAMDLPDAHSPYKGGMGEEYWPSDMHPSVIGLTDENHHEAARKPIRGFHASDSPDWEPEHGKAFHFGTWAAATQRADESGGRNYIHEVEWPGKVHNYQMPDKAANFVSGNRDHQQDEVMGDLAEDHRRFGAPEPSEVMATAHQAFHEDGKALRYTNRAEDEGSTSYVVPDASKLRHIAVHDPYDEPHEAARKPVRRDANGIELCHKKVDGFPCKFLLGHAQGCDVDWNSAYDDEPVDTESTTKDTGRHGNLADSSGRDLPTRRQAHADGRGTGEGGGSRMGLLRGRMLRVRAGTGQEAPDANRSFRVADLGPGDGSAGGEGRPAELTYRPRFAKQLKKLDKPDQKRVQTTVEGLQAGHHLDPNHEMSNKTYALMNHGKGWNATRVTHQIRVIHRPTADGKIEIGACGPHDYKDMLRGLSVKRDVRKADSDAGAEDGMMVCITPPFHVAQKIAIDEGEGPEQIHCTLTYLGKTSEYSKEQLDNLREDVEEWAKDQKPIEATIQGAGTFISAEENGKHVLWASMDAPGVTRWHVSITDHLREYGFNPREDHSHTPHLTLAYKDQPVRFLPKIEKHTWTVDEVWLCIGGLWQSIKVGR